MERIINGKPLSSRGFEREYPFTPRCKTIGNHTLCYLDEGSGPPVVMLHGNPTWSFYYRHLVRALCPSYRTIVPDHIGCGFSDKPSPDAYPYTLKQRVTDLDTLLQRLDIQEKITLIVHDWGGMIGLTWAMENRSRIRGIVITNTSGFLLPQGKRLPLRLWLIRYLTPLAVPAVLGGNLFSRAALYMAPRNRLSYPVKKGLTAPYNSWANRMATLKFVQDIPIREEDAGYKLVKSVDDRLHHLADIPMMILWGRHDFVFDTAFLNEWKRRFPHVPVHLFKDAGHYLFEDKPQETAERVNQFMRQLS